VQTLVWNADDAKDIISETTLIAFERFESIKQPDRFLYFLFSVASNLVKKKQRRKKFWGVLDSPEVDQKIQENESEQNILRKELYAALNKLNEKQRGAIVLFEINGFTIKEIAAIQGVSESGVKTSLRRGRQQLARLLREPKLTKQEQEPLALIAERGQYGK
jgi:RNA polymerase sigma-70 factor (ECF subfamily)